MADLEVRELRYFRAVAAEGSLSRAAEALGMAQPPLSRAIARLERRLGVRLLDRDNRGVALTAAGETLLAEAERVLDAVAAAAHRTRRAAARPGLVVTGKPGAASALLATIVEAYRATPGAVPVEILVSGFGEQVGLVRTGQADLAVVGSPWGESGLDSEPLVREARLAAFAATHPLAAQTDLSVADLAGEPVPIFDDATPEEMDFWSGRDTVPGIDRPAGPVIHDSAQLLEVAALGQAVALVPESLARTQQRADVVYRPMRDASPYELAIAWSAGSRNTLLRDFVRVATRVAGPIAA